MAFIPNIHFTLLIKIQGRLREFNFRKRGDTIYDADTSDERGNRHQFKWTKTNESWEIAPFTGALPAWIADSKQEISVLFDQYVAENR